MLCTVFRPQLKHVSVINISCSLSSLTGCSKCPLATATHDQILLRSDTIALAYQQTPVENHSISSMKQSSVQQYCSALVCISDGVPALRPIHDNPLACSSRAFAVTFTRSLITCLLRKMCF